MVISGISAILMGGVNVSFQTEETGINLACASTHRSFLNSLPPDITITVRLGRPPWFDSSSPSFETDTWSFFRSSDYSAIRMHPAGSPEHQDHYQIFLYANGKRGDLYLEDIHPHNSARIDVPPFALDEILAVELVAMRRGLMFHSSGLKTRNGKGLLFAGVSGAGKSTMARLWQDTGKAILLGDERVVVSKRHGQFWLQGTAWHGSGQATTLGEAPIHDIFILEHADNNQAHALRPAEATALLLARSFLPFWDRDYINNSLEFLNDLCCSLPCYQLGFTPDQRAVDYVQCLISS
jgi:hypothetical protein